MKILIVFNHPAPYKVKLFNELHKHIDVDVIFELKKARNRTDSFYKYNVYNFPTIDLKLHPLGQENVFGGALKRYIKKHHQEYDYIIMNGYSKFAEISAVKMMQKNHIPYVLMINGGVIHREFDIKRKLKTKLISGASLYFSPNVESNKYLTYYGADENKIVLYKYSNITNKEVVTHPLDEEVKKQLCLKYHLPHGQLFINPGQFIARKNNEALMEIFKNRMETLILVGRGPLKKKYEKYIKDNNIHNIFIMDYLDEHQIKEVLKCATALITLSKEDVFGHTVLEALGNGLPVIASNKVISALEMIENGKNGYLVNVENEQEINEAITNVVNLKFEDIVASVDKHTIEETAKDVIEGLKR